MSDRLKYERFIWFHGRVKSSSFPNAQNIAYQFEVSGRTAQRDIEFMRDRLGAPLVYSSAERGYCYTDSAYELPSLWLSEESIVALSLAVRLASSIPDVRIKETLLAFLEKALAMSHAGQAPALKELMEKVSVKNIEYSKVNDKYFMAIVKALFDNSTLAVTYYSPHAMKETERTILPLHLIQYMGSWHVIAHCMLRKGLRDFAISRIRAVKPVPFQGRVPTGTLPSMKEYTRKHFGIIQGGRTTMVHLRFSPSVAEWMQEQVWHPEQQTRLQRDGSLTMKFPASDFRELSRKILSYGSDVKVVSPKKLAVTIQDEIEEMRNIY